MALISVLVHEVVATDITPVEVLWKLRIRDGLRVWISFLILLSQFESLLEVGTLTEGDLSDWLAACLCQQELFFVAVGSVVGMVLLILTGIGLPSKIHLVNSRNKQIGLIGWYVLQMSVVSPVCLSSAEEARKLNVLLICWWST